jgi:hypothetical protein
MLGASVTAAVLGLIADDEPAEFVSVMVAVILAPASLGWITYVDAFVPTGVVPEYH